MAQAETDRRSPLDRERAHADMLTAAVARPGVREAMEVFQDWQTKDQALDAYRAATKQADQITTSNHANIL